METYIVLMDWKSQYGKMSNLSTCIHKFNFILIKNLMRNLHKYQQFDSKIHKEIQKNQNSYTNFKNRYKVVRLTLISTLTIKVQ